MYKSTSLLGSCGAYSSTLKMKATCCSEMSVDFQRSAQHCIRKDKLLIPDAVRTSNPVQFHILRNYTVTAVLHEMSS
jgi:hypothetical protein